MLIIKSFIIIVGCIALTAGGYIVGKTKKENLALYYLWFVTCTILFTLAAINIFCKGA